MKQVLASVDLSPLSRRVADRARRVAEERGASLTLVHVAEPPDVELPEEMLRRVTLYRHGTAENLLAWINARAACPVELKVVDGRVAVEVVKRSREADLLVTGTSSLDHLRVGPRTTRLARKAHSPLLCVRRQPRVPYRRVMAAVDLSEASAAAVELALRFSTGAEKVAMVVSLPSHAEMALSDAGVRQEELDRLRQMRMSQLREATEAFAERWEGRVSTHVTQGPPAEAVAELARTRRADLLVVSNRGMGGSNMVLLGSVAEAMLSRAPCDVAVTRVPGPVRRP